ncbi:MAG TPA: preprotein translocase subunit SecE [Phycisphaerae bacterium]|nr:preprotein translocase subunit SecE [Phycisphaerae bacterium]
MFEVYKRGQGKYTRAGTFAGVMVVSVAGAYFLSNRIGGYTANAYVKFGVPALLVAALAWLVFWIVNRPSSADFMIATESEMKKVSWSSRKEVVGSTKVVIITTFIMAAILFSVDVLFTLIFSRLGIMG